jgi:hypothetical protein
VTGATALAAIAPYDAGAARRFSKVTVPQTDFRTAQAPTSLSPDQIRFLAHRGVELCRRGEWKKGFEVLVAVAETEHREGELPSVFHSYLGYGLARYRNDISAGLALARYSTESRFFEPENFLNLARIEFLGGDRRSAYRSCKQGLKLDPRQADLHRFLKIMGRRREPAVAFLPREHAVNRALGKFARKTTKSRHLT